MPEENNIIEHDWSRDVPESEGLYLMKDEAGGPTLYVFYKAVGGMVCGPVMSANRWYASERIWFVASAEFLYAGDCEWVDIDESV